MLEIKNLVKSYGQVQALRSLNLDIAQGELFGFVGPNGAGKTTTIKILAGLLCPDSGTVYIDGQQMTCGAAELKDKIGYVPDYFGVYDNVRVFEYLEFYAAAYGITGLLARRRYMELLDMVGLNGREESYVDSLSRGMKQRLGVARALVHDPRLLILDEPASGLDPRTRQEFIAMLKNINQSGKTILISSHILSELGEMCTDIGIIEHGQMVLRGSLFDILAMVNSSNPLEIQVYQNLPEAVAFLRRHPLITHVTIDGNRISAGFSGGQMEEAHLLKQMIEAGILVGSFHRRQGGLESVFMQITGDRQERVVAQG
ncbi:MAG: ABC transporter ATP-binding protein [Lachnospiraceae bacterium]|nr:ABC transporter ATP-binding protein [Lachnospiraceae bacterium]